jgi:hypothetical protein
MNKQRAEQCWGASLIVAFDLLTGKGCHTTIHPLLVILRTYSKSMQY